MPKIPQHTIDQIRDRADIVDIISEDIILKKKGVNFFGVCPFHDEKTPSFSVSPSKQIYHCFGCGNGGNVFTFLMEFQKITFYEAVRTLAERYNIIIEEIKKNENSGKYSFIYELHEKAMVLYQKNLFSSKGELALKYLYDRNLREEIIKEYRIGFAINSWDNLYNKAKKINNNSDLMKSGLFVRSAKGVFDRFRSRIMFPIFHQSGKVIAFGGRSFKTGDVAKYLNSPETDSYQKSNILYGLHITKQEIRKKGYAILVEGYMDFLQLYQAGIKNIVAISGTSLTDNHANLLSRITNKIILLYDGDSAGGNAACRAGFVIFKSGMEAYVVRPPNNLDPDDWIIKHGKGEIQKHIDMPIDFLEYHISFNNANKLKGVEKRDYLHDLLFNINVIKDIIIKNEFIKKISENFKIGEIELLKILNDKKSYLSNNKTTFIPEEKSFTSKVDIAELELLKICIHLSKNELIVFKKKVNLELFSHPMVLKIMSKILSDEVSDFSNLLDLFPDKKVHEFLAKLLIEEIDTELSEQIVIDCIRTLKLVPIKKEIRKLREAIKEKENNGQNSEIELKTLMELQNKIAGELK